VSRFSATASATLVAIVVAACSGSSPSSQESSGQGPSVAASAEGSTPASQEALPSNAAGAGSLEGIVPTSVGGITITYQYAVGQDVIGGDAITPEVQDFLDESHADITDVTSATGVGIDQATGTVVSIFALRVAGADEGALRDAFRKSLEADGTLFTEATVGGKQVLKWDVELPTFMYVHEDVVFLVGASSQELSAEALSKLP